MIDCIFSRSNNFVILACYGVFGGLACLCSYYPYQRKKLKIVSEYMRNLFCLGFLLPRIRKVESGKTGYKNRYSVKNWEYDEEGKRTGAKFTHSCNIETADLISSTYYNPSNKTETVYCLPMDLDAHRAEECWKDGKGRLDWGKIGNFLFSTYY